MLVLIKSGPDTPSGKRGVKLARDTSADIVLLQNGVYFAIKEMLDGFCGSAYALREHTDLRGLDEDNIEKAIKTIAWDELVDLMVASEKVVGAF